MKNTYIHTKTQKEFNKALEIFRKKGIVDAYQQEVWDTFKTDTLVRYGTPIIIHSINHAKGKKIISFKKFLYLEAMRQFEGDEIASSLHSSQGREPSHSLGWEPKKDEQYYFISHSGVVAKTRNILELDIKLFEIGNCYKTEAEAQKVLEKRQALRRIHEYMRENDLFFDVDWEDKNQEKYFISAYNYLRDKPTLDCYRMLDSSKGNLIFRTSKDRQQVLDNCAEDLKIFLKD